MSKLKKVINNLEGGDKVWQYNYSDDYLCHYGILGMKWGVRRYQNKDGSLTPAGIKRYAIEGYKQDSYNSKKTLAKKIVGKYSGSDKKYGIDKYSSSSESQNRKRANAYIKNKDNRKKELKKSINKTRAIGIATGIASAALHKIARTQYIKYRNNASPYRVAVVNGAEAASKALQVISSVEMASSYVKQYKYITRSY